MGTVYLGRGRPGVAGYAGRLVAVKVIRPDLARVPEFRARFRREADIARRVARFCTAEVLDVVDPPDGLPYLVTEYIDGLTLAQSVSAEGPLRSADLERLAVSVAAALTSIHGAGLVHRDLKPSNVLLSSLGPRVIDFGIARALDAQTMLSQEIQRVGTPAFMAPEQANGEPVSAAADVFAWGGLVTYAGTGSFPFGDGPTPVQLYRVVHREPLLDGLDPALRPIVEVAMRKDPAARPTAQELFLRLVGMGPSTHPDPDVTRVIRSAAPVLAPPQRIGVDGDGPAAGAGAQGPRGNPAGAGADLGTGQAWPPPAAQAPAAQDQASPAAAGAGPNAPATGDRETAGPAPGDRTPGEPRRGGGGHREQRTLADGLERNDSDAGPAGAGEEDDPAAPSRHGRWNRRRVALLAAPILAVLLIAALMPLALTTGGGQRPSREETAARVALAAEAVRNSDADLAARLSLAAYRISPVREARAALRTSFAAATASVLGGHTESALGVDISPNGRLLASAGADNLVQLWDISDRTHPVKLSALTRHTSWVLDAAFSPDGRMLATVSYDRSAILWDISDPRHPVELATILGHNGWVLDAAFSPDGRTLATSGYDNTARLWDVTDPRHPSALSVLDRHTSWVNEVAFSPDGHLLATASADRTARLWDITDPRRPRPLAAITAHTDYVWTVAFSPDGRRLATGAYDGTARIWDITDPSRPAATASFPADEKWVFDLAFSPDGKTLATAGWDTTVHLWDVSGTGRPASVGTINGHGDWIQALAWTPDGNAIATASDDYTVRISRIDDASLIAAACADPSKQIDDTEWQRHIADVPYQPVC
ncbi:WD40 repeat domain-containing serine/threonine protein kinase [Frankia gtarii]|uniref:WD40 repeat domain-containing serine/threonine protein kinase n=1 Tax=Frankia gtarii TaxID=2950102 RepID=UPI0021C07B52|nr:serine/threonine-protein kinase [Frankia gtarii]